MPPIVLPKDDGKAATFDCTGLAVDLEKDDVIREHLRKAGAVLCPEGLNCELIKNACEDPAYQVLKIVSLQTAEVEGHPQPAVGPLREELERTYKKLNVQIDEPTVVNDSWCIRKFMTFIKMKVRKQKVSTVARINLTVLGFDQLNSTSVFLRLHPLTFFFGGLCFLGPRPSIQVKRFQDLCLTLNPMLEENITPYIGDMDWWCIQNYVP